jgi:hypothetical protein
MRKIVASQVDARLANASVSPVRARVKSDTSYWANAIVAVAIFPPYGNCSPSAKLGQAVSALLCVTYTRAWNSGVGQVADFGVERPKNGQSETGAEPPAAIARK